MKKIYLLSAVALLSLTACNDFEDQFHIGDQITDVKKDLPIVLEDGDYTAIANLAANKALAAQLDEQSGTTAYTDALKKLGTQKYFDNMITADQFLPAFINNKYPAADLGSTFKVTYNEYCGKSEYLADFDNMKGEYTLTADDYNTIWDGASTATYLTPSTENKIAAALKTAKADAKAGDIMVVNYSYSEFEPAGGGSQTESQYTKISDVIAGGVGTYTVKGKVPAVYSRGFLLYDGTGYILVYKTSDVKVGDEVAVSGTTTEYGGLQQYPTDGTEVSVLKAGNGTYTQPKAKTMGSAEFEAYANAPYVAYVTYTGKLTINGNYYNVAIDGTEKQGSLAYVPEGMVSADLNGKNVVVYGYTVGSASKGKYVNTMVTSVAEAALGAKMNGMRRAAASKANKSVVYKFDGTAWKTYTTSDAKVMAVQPAMYEAVGSTTIGKPANYLPQLLQQAYPFAADGQKVAVVYRKSATAMAVVEYTYSATEGWAESKVYKKETTTFANTENGYEAQISMYLNESLLGNEGGFVAYNINIGTLSYVWSNTAAYGWKASAFANKVNQAAESWLVSPALNMKKGKDPVISFEEALNFLGSNNLTDFIQVKVSTNFDGTDVKAATWEDVEFDPATRSAGDSWSFVTVGPASLAKYVGNTIHIAFVYKSTDEVAPTYEFKNIVVKERDAE